MTMNVGGLFAAIGRARPAIESTMTDIEERPRREQAFQSQMGLQGQQRALNQMQIERIQMQNAEMKKEQERQNAPMDITTTLFFQGFSQGAQNSMRQAMEGVGVIDKSGRGKTGNIEKFFAQQAKVEPGLDPWIQQTEKDRHDDFMKKQEIFIKKSKDPNAAPEDVARAKEAMELSKTSYESSMQKAVQVKEFREKERNRESIREAIQKSKQAGEWDKVPPELQNLFLMTEKTGNLKELEETLKQIAIEKAKAGVKQGKQIERTVDLGNKVEYIYTDGTKEIKSKGRFPTQETQSDFDKKWNRSIEIATEIKGGAKPTKQETAKVFKREFGQSDFLSALLGGGLSASESGYTFDPNKGLTPNK